MNIQSNNLKKFLKVLYLSSKKKINFINISGNYLHLHGNYIDIYVDNKIIFYYDLINKKTFIDNDSKFIGIYREFEI
jgi:hypothetical protein